MLISTIQPIICTNLMQGYATTATAAGTTVLTSASVQSQFFTGVTTQTVRMPAVGTLINGYSFQITNRSTGLITVQSDLLNTVTTIAQDFQVTLYCIDTTGVAGTDGWLPFVISNPTVPPQTIPFFEAQYTISNTVASTIAYIPHDHTRYGSYVTRRVRVWAQPGSTDRDLTIAILPNGGVSLGGITIAAGGATGIYTFTFSSPGVDTRLDFSVLRTGTTGTDPNLFGATLEYL